MDNHVQDPNSDAQFHDALDGEQCRVCEAPIDAYELCEKCSESGFGGIPDQGDENQPARGAEY